MDPPIPPKRVRSANFTQKEKEVLFNAVYNYKGIIENKKTDGATWRDKENAWSQVLEEFNTASPNNMYRSLESLKKVYDNEKRKTRKIAAIERQEQLKTGGGVPVAVPEPNNLMLDIINTKTVFGLPNEFDADKILPTTENLFEETVFEDEENIPNLQERDKENEMECTRPAGPHKDWGNYKASYLKEPMNENLSKARKLNEWNERRRPLANSLHSSQISKEYTKLAELKIELVNMQIETLKKESAFKDRESNLRAEILQVELEIKKYELLKYKSA